MTMATINQTKCDSMVSPSGNYTWKNTGVYLDTISNVAGCDSVITVILNVPLISNQIVQTDSATLSAVDTSTTYQWVICNLGFSPIAGAEGLSFNPPFSGEFAVVFAKDGCVDTSECLTYFMPGISQSDEAIALSVFPNPFDGVVHYRANSAFEIIRIRDQTGRVIHEYPVDSMAGQLDLDQLTSGMYFLEFSSKDVVLTRRLMKQ